MWLHTPQPRHPVQGDPVFLGAMLLFIEACLNLDGMVRPRRGMAMNEPWPRFYSQGNSLPGSLVNASMYFSRVFWTISAGSGGAGGVRSNLILSR